MFVLKKWIRLIFRKKVLISLLILLQLTFLFLMVWLTSSHLAYLNLILNAISLFVVLYLVYRKGNASFKLIWIILILLFPIFGGIFYLLFTFQPATRQARKKLSEIDQALKPMLAQDPSVLQHLAAEYPDMIPSVHYLTATAGFPIYQKTSALYLTPGERKFEKLIEELEKAEHYIFLEYFIIAEGIMWQTILDILIRKAAQGVDVRLMYDDLGCFLLLPAHYDRQLADLGIRCVAFNPFRPVLSTIQNNRDHRKIVIIDGHTAFTGGINLADEYINAINRFGNWKDSAIMITGDAVWNLTTMFLQLWHISQGDGLSETFEQYKPHRYYPAGFVDDGYVLPYGDSPMDNENVGEQVYLNIINHARYYVHIMTPYLIIDEIMMDALTSAAKRGIDVRIITPYHWDKYFVHMTSRSYYQELIAAGVRIFEYTPGFVHAKVFLSDDTTATVGTTNLDFRSLFLHFECGVLLQGNSTIRTIKDDFQKTLAVCQEISLLESEDKHFLIRLFRQVLRLFAPLM